MSVGRGTFYNGHKTVMGVSGSRVNLSPRFSVEPSYSVNWVDLEQGSFTTQLLGSRVTYTPTPLMFLSAFLQYNSRELRRLVERALQVGVPPRQRAVRRLQ